MGLDGRKMSKSYDNFIALSEEEQSIRTKTARMFTDPARIKRNDPGHPDKCNVHNYYAVFAPERCSEINSLCRQAQIGCTECKKELAEILIKFLAPIQKKRKELLLDPGRILDILEKGKERARDLASRTIAEVKAALNLPQ